MVTLTIQCGLTQKETIIVFYDIKISFCLILSLTYKRLFISNFLTFPQVVSHDGWNCIDCPAGKAYDSVNKKCASCTGTLETDIDRSQVGKLMSNKMCLTCRDTTEPFSSVGVCRRCHSQVLKVTSGASCACPTSSGM